MQDEKVWKSYVWHEDKCFFVSTIERDYDTYEGTSRGEETLVWDFDWKTGKRGKWIFQGAGVLDHQAICRCLLNDGKIPERDSDEFCRFRK